MFKFTDPRFAERAAEHIQLANNQLHGSEAHQVAASTTQAAARFNAWLFGQNCQSGSEMAARREEAITLFCNEFRQMFIENFDDYVKNYDTYLPPDAQS